MSEFKTTPIEDRLRDAANGLNGDASYLRMLCREAAEKLKWYYETFVSLEHD